MENNFFPGLNFKHLGNKSLFLISATDQWVKKISCPLNVKANKTKIVSKFQKLIGKEIFFAGLNF